MSSRIRLSLLGLLGAIVLLVAVDAAPAAAFTQGAPGAPFGFGSALVGSAPTGNGPSLLAVDPATHTIYVADGNNDSGPNAGGDTVSVIDASRCNAQDVSRCKGPWPTITVGNRTPGDLPSGIAIDGKTDTVYVANVGDNTVSVFNGATCNAQDTTGCAQTPAEVPVGSQPISLFADPANHTVYVANFNNGGGDSTVSMIDSATCNATNLAACPATPPPAVDIGAAPDAVAVDQVTHTAYVTTIGPFNGWAVFDANTCNAAVRSGCGSLGRLVGDTAGPNDGQVDPANDTLYTANFDNTISAFDLRHCWAGDLTGCVTDKPGIVTPFPEPNFGEQDLIVAVDQSRHSVYVSYQKDAVLVVVDTSACNGRYLSACATLRPPTIHTGADPEGVVLDTQTQTLYTANEVDDDISVIDASRCNAHTTSGCRDPAPAVTVPANAVGIPGTGAPTTDAAVHTAYVPSGPRELSMIDTYRCNAHLLTGCAHAPVQATVGTNPVAVTADPGTHTVYVANFGPFSGGTGTISVLDARTCNATLTVGCSRLSTLQVPGGKPDGIVVDSRTDTIYVTTIPHGGPDLISVFNGATCNASDTAGCGQKPALLPAGHPAKGSSDLSVALNDLTNTLYVTNVLYASQDAHTVFVFNGATCDASNTTGCDQTPATVTVGDDPRGLAVDPVTDTVYVVNHAAGDFPGTVSVINGAICNGQDTSGCGQTTATAAAGFGAAGVAVDPGTHHVYVTNDEDTGVSVIDGATCNGTDHVGCIQAPAEDAVGNYPNAVGIDISLGTAYVSNLDNTVSVIPLSH